MTNKERKDTDMSDTQFNIFCYTWIVASIVIYAYLADGNIRKKVNEECIMLLGLGVFCVKNTGVFLVKHIRRMIRKSTYARRAGRGHISRERTKELRCGGYREPYRHVTYTLSDSEKPKTVVIGKLAYDFYRLSEEDRLRILCGNHAEVFNK